MVKIFIILDGVGDRACKLLDGLTPLEAAKTPNLDYFASRGNGGYVYTVNEQLAPESDEAIMALLGYDPTKYYYGRGPLEAYGAGMEFKNGNLALRTNFATVDNRLILDRRVGRTLTTKEAKELEKTINEKVKLDYDFEFRATVGHRGVLVIKGGDFSDNISNVDPAYKRVGRFGVAVNNNINNIEECRALDPERKTKVSANVVNSFVKQCHEILKNHPVNNQRNKKYLLKANAILVRDAGIILPELPKKTGWGAVVSMPLEVGIAKLSGMKVLKFDYPETTNKGLLDNLYKGLNETLAYSKIMIKKGNLSKYFIHFKELDVMGHDNNPIEKKKMIELIDKEFFGYLRKLDDVEFIVTGDHACPCELRGHASDAVPLLHYKKGVKRDTMKRFNESEAEDGYYKQLYGKDVLRKLGFENSITEQEH